MEIILLERIERLGQIGDVVNVKPGFARNYLLPQKKAMRANKENLAFFEGERARIEADNLERRGEAEAVAAKLEGFSITMIRQAGDSGQLYGSVNARDITAGVEESGVSIDRRQIRLEQIIKSLGLHNVKVQLHPEVAVAITVNVARSTEEADQQAAMGRMVTETDREAAEDAAEAARHAAIEAVEAAETEAAEAAESQAAESEAAESEAAESEAAAETEDAGDVDEAAKDA